MAAASHVLTLRIKSNVDDVQGADWPIPADINFRTVLVSNNISFELSG